MNQEETYNDEKFMKFAIEQAHHAAKLGEVPIGAVVVCDGEVIAEGFNQREARQDPSAHAEFTAICQASRELERWRLPDCTVYVTLEPCIMCSGLMHQARIARCVYGASDPKAGALGTLYHVHDDERLNHNFEVTGGVLEDECAGLLRDFFRMRRKQNKEEKKLAKAQAEARAQAASDSCAESIPELNLNLTPELSKE